MIIAACTVKWAAAKKWLPCFPGLWCLIVCISACWSNAVRPPNDKCPMPACHGQDCSLPRCLSNTDCPRGSECDIDNAQCALAPFRKIPSEALMKGFRVPELQLKRVQAEGTTHYEITIPADAKLMTCALFICEPQFNVFDFEGAIGRMVQYGQCAVRDKTFRATGHGSSDVWSLALAELTGTQSLCDEAGPRSKSPAYPVVTDLALGCWALAEIRPIAATRMLKLSLSELPDFGQIPVRSCDVTGGGLDGSYCYLPESLGRCDGTSCDAAVPTSGPASTPATDSSPALTQQPPAPLSLCSTEHQGEVCVRGGTIAVGQCSDLACVPRGVDSIELPLVVSSCAPDLLPDADGGLPSQSNFDTEGLNCFPSTIGSVGTCASARCRQRCATSDDCRLHAESAGLTVAQALAL